MPTSVLFVTGVPNVMLSHTLPLCGMARVSLVPYKPAESLAIPTSLSPTLITDAFGKLKNT